MTFNEARAALAIGCKVKMSHWESRYWITYMNNDFAMMEFKNGNTKLIIITKEYLNSSNWEIYHENQGSNTSP